MAKLLDITFSDRTDLDEIIKRLPSVAAKALNATANSAKDMAIKEITSVYTIPESDLLKRFKVQRATTSRLHAIISVKSRLLSLSKFSPWPTKQGVTVQIKRAGGRKLLRHTFLAGVKSGHIGVFQRKGKARLPIEDMQTISIAQMFNSRRIREKVIKHIREMRVAELKKRIKKIKKGSIDVE